MPRPLAPSDPVPAYPRTKHPEELAYRYPRGLPDPLPRHIRWRRGRLQFYLCHRGIVVNSVLIDPIDLAWLVALRDRIMATLEMDPVRPYDFEPPTVRSPNKAKQAPNSGE